MKDNRLKYLLTGLKGVCMGAADVIPGVSGGTIAFMTGIYEELLGSIKSIDATAVKLLLHGKFAQMWKHVNGNFLLSVFAGILVSVFSLAKLMQYLLVHHPVPTWAFFLGLIIASSVYIIRDIFRESRSYAVNGALILAGIVLGVVICMLSPTRTPDDWWFVLISGAIAICAMILPGISGSFILVILGKYHYIMEAISELNIPVLLIFAAGAVGGIIAFSHLLSWLLKKCRQGTLSVLAGFIIGSLIKVWPWSVEAPSQAVRPLFDWASFTPVLPGKFVEVNGGDAFVGQAVVFALIGFALVFVIEFAAARLKK